MPETTPTAANAHLVTHNHGRTVDTHLHEPAPAPCPRDLPVPTMPIATKDDEPDWTANTWPAKAWLWLGAAIFALAGFIAAIAFTAGALLRAYGFI